MVQTKTMNRVQLPKYAAGSAAGVAAARMECMQVWGGSETADTAVSTTGLDVWLYSKPYGNLDEGGDVYFLSSCSSGRITRLLLADVSGHGEHVLELARRLRVLMGHHINHVNQETLVRSINQELTSIGDASTFATGLIATFFVPTATLTLSNAGHPAPLLLNARRGEWRTLEQAPTSEKLSDVPLGMFERSNYTQVGVSMEAEDLLLWYTDGLEDCVNEQGEALGREGISTLITNMGRLEPGQIIPNLLQRVTAMSDSNLTDDDVTILLIRQNGASVPLRDNLLAPFRYLSGLLGSRP